MTVEYQSTLSALQTEYFAYG